MSTVHAVDGDETPERHTLGDCPCEPSRLPVQRGDGTTEWIHVHRALDEPGPAA